MGRPRVIVIIPAYNEEATVQKVVAHTIQYADVLVVDDCSSDNTAVLAGNAGATVLRNSSNLGYERTLNIGFETALKNGFEYLITMDADGEHNPELLTLFIDMLVDKKTPLVLGVRKKKQRFSETLMGWYIFSRYGVHDILCGFKGYRSHLVRTNGGFDTSQSIGTELTLNSIRRGSSFVEIAVNGNKRRDHPRFDHAWRANMRILLVLKKQVLRDIISCL